MTRVTVLKELISIGKPPYYELYLNFRYQLMQSVEVLWWWSRTGRLKTEKSWVRFPPLPIFYQDHAALKSVSAIRDLNVTLSVDTKIL